jgi:hypothetical protein
VLPKVYLSACTVKVREKRSVCLTNLLMVTMVVCIAGKTVDIYRSTPCVYLYIIDCEITTGESGNIYVAILT